MRGARVQLAVLFSEARAWGRAMACGTRHGRYGFSCVPIRDAQMYLVIV